MCLHIFDFFFLLDLLSPIHSDISLNDVSQFSFGSLPSTPDCDKEIKLPNYKHIIKVSIFNYYFFF